MGSCVLSMNAYQRDDADPEDGSGDGMPEFRFPGA